MLDLKSLIPWGNKTDRPAPVSSGADPFTSFRREVDRLFDDFMGGFGRLGGFHSGPPAHIGWNFGQPSVDVTEHDKELVVTAELPGVDEKDLDITLSGDVLTIKGEKKHDTEQKNSGIHYVERRYGSFSRSIRLPFEAGEQEISAGFEKGVLKVRIPKPAEVQSKTRRIKVKKG